MRKTIITKESIFLDARDKEDILDYYGSYGEIAKALQMNVAFIHRILNGVKPVPASLQVIYHYDPKTRRGKAYLIRKVADQIHNKEDIL